MSATKDELVKHVRAALAKLERRAQVVVSSRGSGVLVMGHKRGQPHTLANFCTIAIGVHQVSPAQLQQWCEEIERELLTSN